MSEYMTLSETSEYIGKSKETLRRWDKEGKLNAVREPIVITEFTENQK